MQQKTQSKALIIYLSRTQNTKTVAEIIHDYTGGDLVAIELDSPYPSDYSTTVKQVHQENNMGYLPPLKTSFNTIKNYDVIFIGFPTWDMQMPPPIKSFLNKTDLSHKIVIPFNTHAGYGVGAGFSDLKKRCVNCIILKGIEIKGGVERDGILLAIKNVEKQTVALKVQHWLQQLATQYEPIQYLLQQQ